MKMINIFAKKNKKVIDTSVLIDGRIVGIIETGFWEGEIVVPNFVLEEIHKLIDSQKEHKNNKGKRGLKILSQIKTLLPIEIYYKQNARMLEVKDVDTKLIFLCKELGARLLTVDFKLNEIASIHGVGILNINDLNNAIKPTFVVGDILEVSITREGREYQQGIGNLDDGTMVIVKNGLQGLGHIVKAMVTNVVQTSSGRLIHTKFLRL